MNNPAAHEAHDLPLADRIINDLIGGYIELAGDTCRAGYGHGANDHERGITAGADQMQYLHLAGWDYRLTPRIVDALRRAGLLAVHPVATSQDEEQQP